ncbi:MAG: rRNA maturation RNAse YbeY [Candidatus Liptonbacteria bacterium]|nr:rRNA maturation RNAse YbeY [Candidatus Liptonbacteria bacterium]
MSVAHVTIIGGGKNSRALSRRLEQGAALLLRRLRVRHMSLDVFLISGREMVKLKKASWHLGARRGMPGRVPATKGKGVVDVLAFPEDGFFPHPDRSSPLLGEIYLNLNLARRDPERALFLLMHGMLHLVGYAHGNERDARRMERFEDKLWRDVLLSVLISAPRR